MIRLVFQQYSLRIRGNVSPSVLSFCFFESLEPLRGELSESVPLFQAILGKTVKFLDSVSFYLKIFRKNSWKTQKKHLLKAVNAV